MLPRFARQTAEIQRAPLVDKRGTLVRDWKHATKHTASRCLVQPLSTQLALERREGVEIDATGYFQPGTDIQADDRVIFDGQSYVVSGEPLKVVSPTGRLNHIQAFLKAYRG